MNIRHRRSIRLPDYDYSSEGAYFITLVAHHRQPLFGAIVNNEMVVNEFGKIVQEEWLKTAELRAEVELAEDEFVVMPNHFHGIINIVERDGKGDRPDIYVGAYGRGRGEGPAESYGLGRDEGPAESYGRGRGEGPAESYGRDRDEGPAESYGHGRGEGPTESYGLSKGDRPVALTKPKGPKPKSLGALIAGFKSAVTTRINILRNTPGKPVWQRNYYEHVIITDREYESIAAYIANNPSHWLTDDERNPW